MSTTAKIVLALSLVVFVAACQRRQAEPTPGPVVVEQPMGKY